MKAMVRLFAVVMLGIVGATMPSVAQTPETPPAAMKGTQTALPPPPGGESTVIGGDIRDVDPVRDQFILRVFGGKSLKVLFDARTQVFRNGVRIRTLDLRPEDHASVETTLDGTNIFALRIHMLSQLPHGEIQGQVLSYDPHTGELTVRATLSQEPIELRVPQNTPVVRVGQSGFAAQLGGTSNLADGALVDVKFKSGSAGRGVATHIDVLAVPGATFVFRGDISFLDLRSGQLVIIDPSDNHSYQVAFDPAGFPVSRELRQGTHVKVTASFDGTRYVASDIAIE